MADEEVRIEYMSLSELKKWERNPKDHDLGELGRSLTRFGFVMPVLIDERSGTLAAGHGRVDSLLMRQAQGESAPARVRTEGGEWKVPVIRGISFNSDGEMEAYGIADNRIVERGGWLEPALVEVLADLAAGPGLDGTGYDEDDLDTLRAFTELLAEDWSDFDEELDELEGYEEVDIRITVPTMHKEEVVDWLANGESKTAPGMGKGVMRRCGLL
jgi:hypothetical protein